MSENDKHEQPENQRSFRDERSGGRPRFRTAKDPRAKVMDYVAHRDHSEQELRTKLGRLFTPEEVDDAVQWAVEQSLIPKPEDMSGRMAVALGRRNKGYRYINELLHSKGLPPVEKNLEEEVRKGRELAEAKIGREAPYTTEEKQKIQRLLFNRGFDHETIKKVIYEKP